MRGVAGPREAWDASSKQRALCRPVRHICLASVTWICCSSFIQPGASCCIDRGKAPAALDAIHRPHNITLMFARFVTGYRMLSALLLSTPARSQRGWSVCFAVCALLLATARTVHADPIRPQCWECLQRLAMQLPAVNPQEDPSYEQGLTPGSVLPALTVCSLDDSEIPDLQRVIGIFTDASVNGGGVAYVRKQLEQVSQVSADDRAKLVDGARQDLDTTLRHLVDHNCRLLLKSHFDEGASRAWLLHMIELGRNYEDR